MEYTHTYEIDANGVNIVGKMNLTGEPTVERETADVIMTLHQEQALVDLKKAIYDFAIHFSPIRKLELKIKAQ